MAGLALLLVDLRYHLRHWRHLLAGAALVGLVAVPYLRYRVADPVGAQAQLQTNLRSYWYEPIPLTHKLARYGGEYLYGLSPQYWFFPNGRDLERHRMLGYAQIRTEMLPLFLLGVAVCLRHLRAVPHRTLLILALAAPFGAAVVAVNLFRALPFAVLASAFAVLGLDALVAGLRALWSRLTARPLRARGGGGTRPPALRIPLPGVVRPLSVPLPAIAGALVFAVLAGSSLHLLHDALTNGPRWYRDYTLYGQQWGAKQVFDVIRQYVRDDPQATVYLTPTWANGSDMFPRFFFRRDSAEARRVVMTSVDDFLGGLRRDLTPKTVVVMTSEELERAGKSGKFASIQVERVIPFPDGRPGFHFARLAYVPDIEAVFAAEREARRALVDAQVTLGPPGGAPVRVRHSVLDSGSLREMFDGDRQTLGRFMEANPALLELDLPQPRHLTGLSLLLATGNYEVTARLTPGEGAEAPEPVVYTLTVRSPSSDPQIELPFDGGPLLTRRNAPGDPAPGLRGGGEDPRTGATVGRGSVRGAAWGSGGGTAPLLRPAASLRPLSPRRGRSRPRGGQPAHSRTREFRPRPAGRWRSGRLR